LLVGVGPEVILIDTAEGKRVGFAGIDVADYDVGPDGGGERQCWWIIATELVS
jgi:hypothetical protein